MNAGPAIAGVFAVLCNFYATAAFPAATDYAFEPVLTEYAVGDDIPVQVRLMHKPSGRPVPDAVVFRTRVDMSPDGMAEMEAPVSPVPADALGTYAFKTDLSMAGRYLFSIAAKVQGEPETVVGKVMFRAAK